MTALERFDAAKVGGALRTATLAVNRYCASPRECQWTRTRLPRYGALLKVAVLSLDLKARWLLSEGEEIGALFFGAEEFECCDLFH